MTRSNHKLILRKTQMKGNEKENCNMAQRYSLKIYTIPQDLYQKRLKEISDYNQIIESNGVECKYLDKNKIKHFGFAKRISW